MGNYTREEILAMAEEEDVEFIRLQFTDMFGTLKNIAITARELPRALDNQCVVYGSHIAGIVGEKEPDLILYPDYDTFSILPWRPQQGKVARLICDMRRADGSEHEMSSRYILKKTAQAAEEAGYTCYVDPECEFFLFHIDDNGMPTTVSHEKAGYLDVSPVDLGENARRDMVLTLEDMGFEVESSHHETAPAQHEIALHYGEAREMADAVMTFKMAVRTVAKRHGLHATFMPKPRREVNGSAMHIHFSLFKNGRNIFVDPDDPSKLSNEACYFIGGLLAHSREMALVTNPLVNSYKRIVPGNEAPAYIVWSSGNRSPLISVPRTSAKDMHIELRNPDPCVNSYLAFAGIIAAGLEGIKKGLMPQAATELNIYRLSEEECEKLNLKRLPKSLSEAVEEMENDPLVMKTLGEYISGKYVRAKRREVSQYQAYVTDWETGQYLNKY